MTLLRRIESWALQNGHVLALGWDRDQGLYASLRRLDSEEPWLTGYGRTTNEVLRNVEDGLIEDGLL